MIEYIETLAKNAAGRDSVKDKLRDIFRLLIDAGYCIVAVRIKPGLLERLKSHRKPFLSIRGVQFFAATTHTEVDHLLSHLSELPLWHVSTLQFWIGSPQLPAALLARERRERISQRQLENNALFQSLSDFVVGGVDPLDDEMYISGTPELRQVLGHLEKEC
jgi:hypothetical protein